MHDIINRLAMAFAEQASGINPSNMHGSDELYIFLTLYNEARWTFTALAIIGIALLLIGALSAFGRFMEG